MAPKAHFRAGRMRIKLWQWICASVVVALLIGKHVLLDTAAAPGEKFVIDVAALHRTAIAQGQLPERIEVEKVADFSFRRTLVIAGEGFGLHPMVLLAHRVVWPNRSLLIDTAMPPAAAMEFPRSRADAAAFARVAAALAQADTIVFTHEHHDHVGGLAVAQNFAEVAPKVQMTREQLNGPLLDRAAFAPGALDTLKPLDYTGLHLLAPGVVLQKAPGHSVGTQLVYVELANGTRYLFVGDIAWTKENIARQVGRPALLMMRVKEDRHAVAAQVQALAGLPKDVHVIVAHDAREFEQDLESGLLKQGFTVL